MKAESGPTNSRSSYDNTQLNLFLYGTFHRSLFMVTSTTYGNMPPPPQAPRHDGYGDSRPERSEINVVNTGPTRRISWGAVAAGTVTALAIQLLLAMLGTGIGASTVDTMATGETPSAEVLGGGAAIWWVVSSLVSLMAGGWVAGRLSGVARTAEGGMHGMLTWAVAVLATVYLVSSAAGSLMRGAAGVLGTAATVTATGAAAAAPKIADVAGEQMDKAGVSFESIKREAMAVLKQTGKPELQPGNVEQQAKGAAADASRTAGNPSDQDFSALLERLLSKGRASVSEVDREAVINVVMSRSNISREEATKRVAGWEATAEQTRAKAAQAAEEAKVKAREVADASAKALSRAMLLGFLALALGGLVAWWGGTLGQRRDYALR
jgi:uncharacterized protein (DUF2147 family)